MDTDYFTLVLGELVPKRNAMKRSDSIARSVSGLMIGMSSVLKPVIWLLTVSTNAVLRLCGIDPNDNAEEVSEEEIIMMLDEGEEAGSIESGEKKLIKNVFALNDTSAENVMVHRSQVCFLRMDDPAKSCWTKLQKAVIRVSPSAERVSTMLSAYFTLEDILEELVGEIWDENDEITENIKKHQDGSCGILGSTPLQEMCDELKCRIDSQADTVGGWVIEQLGAIPSNGDSFDCGDMYITVTSTDERRVLEVNVNMKEEA